MKTITDSPECMYLYVGYLCVHTPLLFTDVDCYVNIMKWKRL